MAFESSSIAGSGISALREPAPTGSNVPRMRGTNAIIANYEDVNSLLGIVQNTAIAASGNTAEQLTPPATRLRRRRKIIVQNLGPSNAYIGTSDVTANNGLQIGVSGMLELDILDVGDLYVTLASGAIADIRVLELR